MRTTRSRRACRIERVTRLLERSTGRSATTGTSSTPSCRRARARGLPGRRSGVGRREAQRARRARRRAHRARTPTSSTPTRRSLVRYDRWANEVDEIEHHPAMLDSKRALWECGYVSGFAADEAARGRTTPGVVIAAAHYLVSQADTGLVCSTGHDEWRRGTRRRVRAARRARRRCSRACAPTTSSRASTVRCSSPSARAAPTSATPCTAPRATSATAACRSTARSGSARTSTARRSRCSPGPKARPKGRPGSASTSCPGHLDDGSAQPLHDPPAQGQARHEERADRRGRVPRRDRLRAARAARRRRRHRRARAQPHDGDGERLAVRRRDDGSRHRAPLLPRIGDLGAPPAGAGPAARRPPARARAARRPAGASSRRRSRSASSVRSRRAGPTATCCAGSSCPAAKARLCRLGVEAASATVELYGGNGYCEDWGLTRQLRDAQCHPIWEGSENVCVLDVLRAMRRDGAHEAVLARVDDALRCADAGAPAFARRVPRSNGSRWHATRSRARIDEVLAARARRVRGTQRRARPRALVATMSAALLLEQSVDDARKALVALRYVRRHLLPGSEWDDRIAIVTRVASCSPTTRSTSRPPPRPPPDQPVGDWLEPGFTFAPAGAASAKGS